MTPRGRPGVAGTPRDGQPGYKQRNPVYRSLEGALGQALRLSRRSGRAPSNVWQNDAGEFVIHPAADVPGESWRLVATVHAQAS